MAIAYDCRIKDVIESNRLDILEKMLHQIDINDPFFRKTKEKFKWGTTALMYCCVLGRVSMVHRLLAADVPIQIDQQDKYKQTALHYAIHHGDADIIRILLDHKANVNIQDNEGATPLFTALVFKHPLPIIRMLLQAGSDPNIADKTGISPLMAAFRPGVDENVVRELLHYGADVNHRCKGGRTPLFHSLIDQAVPDSAVMMLINAGAEIDVIDNDGMTPLLYAYGSSKRSLDMVKMFIDHTSAKHLNTVPKSGGATLLMRAVNLGEEELAQYLLNVDGIDPDVVVGGATPIQAAYMIGNKKLVRMLVDSGCNTKDKKKLLQRVRQRRTQTIHVVR